VSIIIHFPAPIPPGYRYCQRIYNFNSLAMLELKVSGALVTGGNSSPRRRRNGIISSDLVVKPAAAGRGFSRDGFGLQPYQFAIIRPWIFVGAHLCARPGQTLRSAPTTEYPASSDRIGTGAPIPAVPRVLKGISSARRGFTLKPSRRLQPGPLRRRTAGRQEAAALRFDQASSPAPGSVEPVSIGQQT
jgi:hypothetical protein